MKRTDGHRLPRLLAAAILAALLAASALLALSCELAAPPRRPGKIWVVTVGIEYEGCDGHQLEGTAEEARAVGDCLRDLAVKAGRPCDLSRFYDKGIASPADPKFPSKANIARRIGEAGAGAGPDDTLIVYLSCHGYPMEGKDGRRCQEGAVYGGSGSYQRTTFICTPDSKGPLDIPRDTSPGGAFWKCSDFIDVLRGFPGQKCVLADFCYSGSLVAENNVSVDSRIYSLGSNDIDPLGDLLFRPTQVSQVPDLFILSSCKPYEESYIDGTGRSFFTDALLWALGWDREGDRPGGAIPACEGGLVALQSVADRAQEFMDSSLPRSRRQRMKITGSSEDLVLFQFDRGK